MSSPITPPSPFQYDLICIGSGPAGQRAAIQAAKIGKRVAVIEKKHVVGGACLETGTIPSKTFREAVMSFTGPHQHWGRSPEASNNRPTAEQLVTRVAEVIRIEGAVMNDQLRRNDVELLQGDAFFMDPHTLSVRTEHQVQTVSSANILIAVGTVPTPPPNIPIDGQHILDSDSIIHLAHLPRTMTVIGAGIIGIEYASMFGALGVEVTLVDSRIRPLEFLDGEIVDELIYQMRNHQVTFRLGETVEKLEIVNTPSRKVVIHLASGKRLVSGLALYSVGRTGATAALQLDKAGLTADTRGRLPVDAQFRTTVPHILAAGDVIGFPSLAATSSEQGRLAACYAFALEAEPMTSLFPVGIYAIPEISMVGATEEQLTLQKVPYEVGIARYREIARGTIMGDPNGMLKLLFHRNDHRLLGVHVIGTGATELIHIGQAILHTERGLEYFLTTVFNYPTLAECYKVAALDAYNKLCEI
ncbi:MAG: Si-specific NAD(P)(+) transhydrogenase [Nitrospirales bacterium]|nr:Si-specific NAD(P)(+) transhydrogenase [Nitrospira sp.]MDR4462285.1 Si-specific NAD(P)(+) transhydrogenase [Nitrospirales bacterium]